MTPSSPVENSTSSEVSETLLEDKVLDDAEAEQIPHTRFQITSYGADMTVFELTHRLEKDLIIPPAFQRKYVWSKRQASRFIESLLMGLPIPGIFLYKDHNLKKQLLVDGLQRLQTFRRCQHVRQPDRHGTNPCKAEMKQRPKCSCRRELAG